MNNDIEQSNVQSFSMRKIPVINNPKEEFYENVDTDKIKIFELSNIIDEWEKEILFSDNGFFSLQGIEVENKMQDFYKELVQIVNKKISQYKFSDIFFKEKIKEISNLKLYSIQKQMKIYEQQQLKNWTLSVYEQSVNSATQRAVLYKNNPEIIAASYKNAIESLLNIAQLESWNKQTLSAKKASFESDFYSSLIAAFIADKDVNANIFFEKYSDKLLPNIKLTLEKSVKELKNSVIAYNWAVELFSYNLSESENEKEINSVKDKEIRELIHCFFKNLQEDKKNREEYDKKSKNCKNWEKIISILDANPVQAELYIDYSFDEQNIKIKKNYIKNILKNGFIKTDKTKFLKIFGEIFSDFEKFKQNDISDYREFLSEEDFKLISSLQTKADNDFELYKSDYDYLQNEVKKLNLKTKEELYSIIKILFTLINTEIEQVKKEPDIEKRNKLINSILNRFTVKQAEVPKQKDNNKKTV